MQKIQSHFTATGFVLNKAGDKGLVILHNKLQIWLPPGGHLDDGEVAHEAVIREVFEETGVTATVTDCSPCLNLENTTEIQIPAPIFVLHEFIPAYKDKPDHMHYDFIYSMKAVDETLNPQLSEVAQVKWVTLQELRELKTTGATLKIYELILNQFLL